jgi:adenosylmethionine-8-amino-7-oxononanoate aminotransferase
MTRPATSDSHSTPQQPDTSRETLTHPLKPTAACANSSSSSSSSSRTTIAERNKAYWSAQPKKPSLLHRSLHEQPILAANAYKNHLTLQDGTRILDACGGAAVAVIGHGNEEVIRAMAQQALSVAYVHTLAYTTQAAEDLAEFLVGHRPGGLSKAFFVGSGSEANDGAMKLARQFFFERGEPRRVHFIARRQAYHGNTWGAMSLSNNVSRLVPYKDVLLPDVSHVSPCYPYQYQQVDESDAQYVRRLAGELDDEFVRVGSDRVVAFFAETVGGATSGCITAPPGYFAAMKAVCRKHGALFVLDEVMCGMGRTGSMMAWEQEEGDASPDIMTIGKGLGGGYSPIAGILVHEDVVDQLDRGTGCFNHGHTYQAHPTSCAAALAVQKIVQREGLVQTCARLGKLLEASLRKNLAGEPHVGDIRGRGLFWAIEFVSDKTSKAPFDTALKFGLSVQRQALELGVNVYPGSGSIDGVKGDHVLIAPPYTVTEAEIETIASVVLESYRQVVSRL